MAIDISPDPSQVLALEIPLEEMFVHPHAEISLNLTQRTLIVCRNTQAMH
jgi:hypothetical protein